MLISILLLFRFILAPIFACIAVYAIYQIASGKDRSGEMIVIAIIFSALTLKLI